MPIYLGLRFVKEGAELPTCDYFEGIGLVGGHVSSPQPRWGEGEGMVAFIGAVHLEVEEYSLSQRLLAML